jgi:adenosylcobinamide-GDP ribazoletransferase
LGFVIGLRFLTIIPLPFRRQATPEEIGRSVVYFPLVGLLLGLILVGVDRLLGLVLPLSLVNISLIIVMAVLTGALHLDGFIDTCDGAMVRSTPEERLRIMADSRVGAFGVVGACCLILLKYLALDAVPDDLRAASLVLMPVLGRWAMVFAIGSFAYVREVGTGRAFKEQASWRRVAVATAATILLSALFAGLSGLAVMASVWVLILGIAVFLRHRLGGLSGDTYGAINEAAETLLLVLLPVMSTVLSTHFIGAWNILEFGL